MPEAHDSMVVDVIWFLLSAVLAAIGVQRLKWSPVVGYLIAGIIIGPYGLGLVDYSAQIRHLAEFGIVFLMFTIGLDLSFSRLKAMRKIVFGLGGLQVTLTSVAIALLAIAFGVDMATAAVLGMALSLSSTAVVMRLLMDQEMIATRIGRRAFGVLLFQDIAVVPILLLVGLLIDGGGPRMSMAALIAIVQAVLAVGLVILLGRFAARPLFRMVAGVQSAELFAASTLLVVLVAAWLLESAGLSMELGAFLAGMMLAETEYHTQVQLDIAPYRGLLLGLFFITIGMAIDPQLLLAKAHWILLVLAALLITKTAFAVILARFFGLAAGESWRFALLLAQGGEFAFVVFAAAMTGGLLDMGTAQILIVVVGVSVAVTPALDALGNIIERHLMVAGVPGKADLPDTASELEGHVIIAGFGRVGRILATVLSGQNISYVALDLNARNIAKATRRGLPVFYGNAANADIMRAAGLGRASAVVVTLDSALAAGRAVQMARRLNPGIPIIVRARDHVHSDDLEALGATASVPETLESSLQLGGQVLRTLGLPPATADEVVNNLRADDYAGIRKSDMNGI